MFTKLATAITEGRNPPFDFAVVDEAQDIGVAVWSKYSNAQRVSSLHLSKGRLPPLARSQTQTLSC